MCSSTAFTTHYRGGTPDAAAERRDKQDEFHSAAQARVWVWAGGGFDADHGFAFDGVGRSAHWSRASGIKGGGGGRRRRLCGRAPLSPLHTKKKEKRRPPW
jgi:hypothetical protein